MQTRPAIVRLLKTEGPMDSAALARRLKVTPMAVRQHLYALQRERLVTAEERPAAIGRPAKYWSLTPEANRLFPDAYAELSVALLGAAEAAFGAPGMQRLLDARLTKQRSVYGSQVPKSASLEKKLKALARLRTEEGYMAEVRRQGRGRYLFIEHHCPICAAATACQGFCSTELDLFRSVLGPGVRVERSQHILAGDRGCVYEVSTVPAP